MITPTYKLYSLCFFTNFFFVVLYFWIPTTQPVAAQTLSASRRLSPASVTGFTALDIAAFNVNPALYARVNNPILHVSVSPSRFGLAELSHGRFIAGAPITRSITAAIDIAGMGGDLFSEFTFIANSAFKASDLFVIGVAAELDRRAIRNSESQTALQLSLGSVLSLSEHLTAGFALRNLNRAGFGPGNGDAIQTASMGVGIHADSALAVETGVEVALANSSAFILAAAYSIGAALNVRAAIRSNPRLGELGIAAQTERITVTASVVYHDVLGFSQVFGVNYFW